MTDASMDLDSDPDITLRAVGVGLSVWEIMESQLATLYSIFKKKPRQIDMLAEFGKEGRVTAVRIDLCKDTGEKYFFARPDQGFEMRFDAIIKRAKALTINRHQIAHGVLMSIPVYGVEEPKPGQWVTPVIMWGLGWPWYSRAQLHPESFMYGSKKLGELTAEFAELSNLAASLANDLSPP